MKKIEEEEMKQINGGVNVFLITAVTTAIIFLSGVITGIVNPTRCNHS